MKKLAIWFASIALSASAAFAAELDWTFSFAPDNIALAPRGEYTVVSLADGSDPRDAIGAPAIPARFANILLPDGATDVSVSAVGDLVPLASDVTPWPVQRVAPKSKPQPPFTAPDPAAYASADPWPAAAATFEGVHEMQGSTFVSVRVNPLVYVAAEKALYYRPSVAVTVTYTPAASAAPRAARSVSQNALATEMVNALVVNPEAADAPAARARRAAARASAVDYLIITSSGLSSAFQNLADYRATAAGGSFKTLVVTTNDIASSYSGDDIQMKIRNCISNYVKNSGTTYVVIGGDDKIVPDRDCYGNVDNETYEWHMPTDLYYSDLTGTWKASGNTNFGVVAASVDMSPDVIVGRIPVRTAAQLNGYLAKVQAFESDTSHTRNSIIMGGPAAWCRYYGSKRPSDNVSLDGHAAFRSTSPAHTYVSDSEMWLRRLYRDGIYTNWNRAESASTRTVNIACDSITSWDTSSCGDKELSASNLKTWLNNGYTHLMFSGHGYPQGWGMEGSANYSTTQAAAQTGLVAFVYTDACLTGAFDEDGVKSSGITVDVGTSDQYTYTSEPCLGEAYIRNTSGGALVHMGCARYGWGTPDASSGTSAEDSDGYYTNYTATATSDGGPSTIYAYKFYKRLYESAAVSSNRTLGAAFAMSKADMISQCSSDGCERWIQFGLNYLGDPAITLYPRTVADTAPAFSSSTASTNGYTGEAIYFDFTDLLSAGYPEPTFTVSTSVSSSLYEWADGILEFTPSAAGTYTFACTASNTSGTATCTLTVTVTAAPPETPEVPSTSPVADATSFTATWSAVSDAASYKLYVQQKVTASASSRAARATETVLEADFSDTTGWTLSGTGTYTSSPYYGAASPSIKFDGTGDYAISPEFSSGASLSFWAYGNNGSGSTFAISGLVNGSWTEIETVTIAQGGDTYEVALPSGTTQLRFDFTKSVNCALDDVVVTGSSDTWEDVPGSPFTVSGTSRTVSGLSAGTEYRYAVTAVNSQGVESDPSPYVTVETAEGDSAPAISVEQTSYAVTVGDPDVDFTVTVTGSPAPTVTHSCTEEAYYVFEDGEFLFTPDTVGTYHFVFTATNSQGSDSVTVTVTVSAAPVTVPTLLVDDCTDTTAYAIWDECTGVTSYTLQLASDNQFTTGGSGAAVLETDFSDTTGWTLSGTGTYSSSPYYGAGSPSIKFDSTGDYAISPEFSSGAKLSFWAYGNGGSGSTFAISGLVNSVWALVDTVEIAQGADTYEVNLPAGTTQIRFDFTRVKNCALDDVVVTGASGSGSLISSTTVNGTEYTFTGLSPYTVYYARVKGNADWSNVEEFITEEETVTDTAPSWKATFPATGSVNVGEFYTLANVSSYVSGSPAPTITLDAPAGVEAELADDTFTFAAEASGSYTFTFTAANGISPDATATLVVTAVGQAPVLTASQGTAVAATVGDTVEFTVTATGNPAPTVAMAATEYDAIFENGEFAFAPDAVGTYAFTFTAANSEGTDTLTVTVTVSAAPVTVPTLLVGDVTDTTAYATWDECTGVASYTLQLSTAEFDAAGGASRDATPVLSEDFSGFASVGSYSATTASQTVDSGTWSYENVILSPNGAANGSGSAGYAQLKASAGYLYLPPVDNPATLTVVARASAGSLTLEQDVSGTWTEIDSWPLSSTGEEYTHDFTDAGTAVALRFAAASKATYIHDVAISANGGGDDPGGDDVQTFTVADTEYTFTGLTPETTYYARVKGNADWSNVEQFTTEPETTTDTAPAWSASFPATASVNVGELYELAAIASYVSGSPTPVITFSAPDGVLAEIDNGNFQFIPETSGDYTFTFTAANGISSDATATLVVTAVGQAPILTASLGDTIDAVVGDNVEFTVTASGIPAPTVAMATTEYDAIFENGAFLFAPDAVGTYAFTFTASNTEGTDTLTVTVTVTGGGGALETYVEWLERSGLDPTIPATASADDGKTYQWHYVTDTIPGSGQEPGIVITDASSGTLTVSGLSEFRYYQLVYTTDLTLPLDSYTAVDLGWGEDVGTEPFPVEGDWFGGIRVLLDEP